MNEMVRTIGLSLEEEILLQARASAYFTLILDEATDISVNKQLGFCIQYLWGRVYQGMHATSSC